MSLQNHVDIGEVPLDWQIGFPHFKKRDQRCSQIRRITLFRVYPGMLVDSRNSDSIGRMQVLSCILPTSTHMCRSGECDTESIATSLSIRVQFGAAKLQKQSGLVPEGFSSLCRWCGYVGIINATTFISHRSSLQPSVAQHRWQAGSPCLKPWFSVKKCRTLSLGQRWASASSGGVEISQDLLHKWERNGVGDWLVDQCSICSSADCVLVCCGEEKYEPKGSTIYVPTLDYGPEQWSFHFILFCLQHCKIFLDSFPQYF